MSNHRAFFCFNIYAHNSCQKDTQISHERPAPRSIATIFSDIRALTHSDGALHALSSIIYRDWVLAIDTQDGKVLADPEERWSTNKLNNNELMLLFGTLVQSPTDRTHCILPDRDTFVQSADKLLREFHDALMTDCALGPGLSTEHLETPRGLSAMAREAIYYGPDSFFLSQFEKFAHHRYKEDGTWLLRNAGISIRPMLEIARYISKRINNQMAYASHTLNNDFSKDVGLLSQSLLIPKSDLRKKFGTKVEAFLSKFSINALNENAEFTEPFAINRVNAAPLLDLGDYLYVTNQYRLFGSIYESPFYWTMSDPKYKNTASVNRGRFLEKATSHIFRQIFEEDFVHENVTIRKGKDVLAEADTLIVYGEFVIVVQVKSKRVTMKARAGDFTALKADFGGAIQDPYSQAYNFAKLLESGMACLAASGKPIEIPQVKRIFPVVILSDAFPGVTFLSGTWLERDEGIAPVILDIATLDCISQILPTPVDLIFYLKSRSDAFGRILSDSEYNFLGYHLQAKLAVSPEYNLMMLDRDFASVVDDYMLAKEVGAPTEKPTCILDRIDIPIISELFEALKPAPPSLAGIVIDLYGFSGQALRQISETIADTRKEVLSGKVFRAFSIPTESGGLTYLVAQKNDAFTQTAAKAIGEKYKYDLKRDRWYVVLDNVQTNAPFDALLPILHPWKEDESFIENSQLVEQAFNSRKIFAPIQKEVSDSSLPSGENA